MTLGVLIHPIAGLFFLISSNRAVRTGYPDARAQRLLQTVVFVVGTILWALVHRFLN